MILEPCCYKKHLTEWLNKNTGTEHIFTFGDVDLPMLMDYFVPASPQCDVYLVLVQVEPETLYAITKLMEARIKNTSEYLVKSFVLLHQGKNRKLVHDALDKYRSEGRLLMCEHEAAFRCLCVGNGKNHIILQGSIPQTKNYAMQMLTLTTTKEHYDQVMRMLNYPKTKKV